VSSCQAVEFFSGFQIVNVLSDLEILIRNYLSDMKLFEALNQQFSMFRQGLRKMLWGEIRTQDEVTV